MRGTRSSAGRSRRARRRGRGGRGHRRRRRGHRSRRGCWSTRTRSRPWCGRAGCRWGTSRARTGRTPRSCGRSRRRRGGRRALHDHVVEAGAARLEHGVDVLQGERRLTSTSSANSPVARSVPTWPAVCRTLPLRTPWRSVRGRGGAVVVSMRRFSGHVLTVQTDRVDAPLVFGPGHKSILQTWGRRADEVVAEGLRVSDLQTPPMTPTARRPTRTSPC